MKTYSYSAARKNLDMLLQEAKDKGAVGIRRKDGDLYRLEPVPTTVSPFSGIQGVKTGIGRDEIVSYVREGRDV
ncbi:MAG TPA: type II toxin-antitoxin system Phd/YefM family antitoxin [Candidatus Hydrogenedentes bacterium]|jgi:hypothetical protein|nr:type II toxin-antitoxin system Phd/YefM family antitoxin [Candidatus Hydrogenedentota bacterium]